MSAGLRLLVYLYVSLHVVVCVVHLNCKANILLTMHTLLYTFTQACQWLFAHLAETATISLRPACSISQPSNTSPYPPSYEA